MKQHAIAIGTMVLIAAGAAAAQDNTTSAPKTREQVRAEIEQARRDGILPFRRYDYPPSKATIERNKELYAITHPNTTTTQNATPVAAE